MILAQYDSCFIFNIKVNNRKEEKKKKRNQSVKKKNAYLHCLGYSKAKNKFLSSSFLKTFNRTLGSRKESTTVFLQHRYYNSRFCLNCYSQLVMLRLAPKSAQNSVPKEHF